MFRATTPLHKFVFEQNPELYVAILITYAQNNRIVLEKRKEDLTFEQIEAGGYMAKIKLSQEEANLFKPGSVSVQVRVLTEDGDALSCEIKSIGVKEVLNDEVLE